MTRAPGPGRLLVRDALRAELAPLPLSADDVLAGTPAAGLLELHESSGFAVGVWELTDGEVRDVEADEVFVLLAGRGTVHVEDGEVIELTPGAVVRLYAGDRTRWAVTETLRKVYVTLP